jgi:Gram-negative bacterial TonB protein C-terminal
MSVHLMEPTGKTVSNNARPPFTERGTLRLFVPDGPTFAHWWESLAVLASRAAPRSSAQVCYFLRGANLTRVQFAGRPLGASFLLHAALVALLIYLPQAIPARAAQMLPTPLHVEKIYYRISPFEPAKMPRIAPAGPGGRPGSGTIPVRLPSLGSIAPHPNMTIVSHPVHPDNFRQTIIQPSSPPDLKITTEQKLPNIVLGNPAEALKAPLNPNDARPNQTNRQISTTAAPAISATTNPAAPLMTFLKPSDAPPRLAIPLAGGGGPVQRVGSNSGSPSGASSGDAGLVVLGVDPADSAAQVSLPPGNRWGEFSIAPPSGTPGSPGGDPNGTVGGGSGGGTMGGDGSIGVGPGGGGGGGGNSAPPGPVSVSGTGTNGDNGGILDPAIPLSMVYPVAAPAINVRKNALVISAGPLGGGGLNVYGALSCGKIYSIFLPMPGKSWSMQYCDKSAPTHKMPSEVGGAVIHLDSPLIPPDYDVAHRFDFKRIPVPIEKAHRMIVLKGVLAVDGTVQHLVVYEGVQPEMDEAARLAFSRWQFKPAKKNGKPIEVEILVGIPSLAGDDRINH